MKVQSRKLKNYREMINVKKNLEIVAYPLIKVLELFTSEFGYLGIKVREKSGFILILCLFLDDTFSKIERDGKLFRKRCKNFKSCTLSRWLYEDISCGLLIIIKQKVIDTKKKSQFLKKSNGGILEFCVLCQDKYRSPNIVYNNTI